MTQAAQGGRSARAACAVAVIAAFTLMPLSWPDIGAAIVAAQGGRDSVQITLPSSVAFYVTNLSASTPALSTSLLTFSNLQGKPGRALQISVRAEARRFTAPFGPPIDVGLVSWRTTNSVNGVGMNGTLSQTDQDVYLSVANALNGGVTLAWTLAPPPRGIAAGTHAVTLRWRVRSVNP